ncbi:MAG: helix-turn-helix domain-containing protein [Chlorobi bacterium]|nr:helix-turn-helix domain-containing protein [Chlorobiota bacterium]
MNKIANNKNYEEALDRIEFLLTKVGNNTSIHNPFFIELDELSDEVAKYEEMNFPVPKPSLRDVIELRMFERKLNQKTLAELLGTNSACISEYMKGKREITLKIAKALYHKLNIDPDIILSV